MKITTKGTRLAPTKRHFQSFDLAKLAEARTFFAGNEPSAMDDLERQCWAILKAAGLPSKPGIVLVRRGCPGQAARKLEWRKPTKRDHADITKTAGWDWTHPSSLGDAEYIPFDSNEGYASRILWNIEQARWQRAKNDIEWSMEYAARAAFLAGEVRMAQWYSDQKSNIAQQKNAPAKRKALQVAADTWASQPDTLIGDVVEKIGRDGCKQKPPTIRGWLIEADKHGALKIPAAARKPGRPHK